MSTSIDAIADELADMRFALRKSHGLPDGARPASLAEAYAAQEGVVARLLARRGGHVVGYKTACTSALAREQLKVPHPLYGQLLSHSTYLAPVTLRAAEFTLRTIEPEFGFQMAADVPASAEPYSAETIAPFVGDAFPGIEIVDHRFYDWSAVGAPTIAADNAIHGAYVRGASYPDWRTVNLVNQTVTLTVDGTVVRTGTGAAVLGSPLTALAWLANELQRFGKALKRGDLITTGVVCDVFPGQAGQSMSADFGPLGSVSLSFE